MIPSAVEQFWHGLRQRHFLVVGCTERTGLQAAQLFTRQGVPFSVSDQVSIVELQARLAGFPVAPRGIFGGPQTLRQLAGVTDILLSPGVPRSIPLLSAARDRAIPIWCDYDLLYPLCADRGIGAITGTDGKTTTTLLLSHMLSSPRAGPDPSVVVAGNVGTPITAVYDQLLTASAVVLELSSFMLEDLKRFRATVSTVTNIDQDHVDRYASLAEYASTKRAILSHARPTDTFIQNLDDARIAQWDVTPARRLTVSRSAIQADASVAGGVVRVGQAALSAERLQIRGHHHQLNVAISALMATVLGVPAETALARAARFPGVPHRFQQVGQWAGVDLIDDSKATSVQAVRAALDSLSHRRVVLILGGRDKQLNADTLGQYHSTLRAVVGYGEAGPRLLQAVAHPASHHVPDFENAVRTACRIAESGDVVLLSPACTSFDQHQDYVHRANVFRRVASQELEARASRNLG